MREERIAIVIPKDRNEWGFKKVIASRRELLYQGKVIYFYGGIFP